MLLSVAGVYSSGSAILAFAVRFRTVLYMSVKHGCRKHKTEDA